MKSDPQIPSLVLRVYDWACCFSGRCKVNHTWYSLRWESHLKGNQAYRKKIMHSCDPTKVERQPCSGRVSGHGLGWAKGHEPCLGGFADFEERITAANGCNSNLRKVLSIDSCQTDRCILIGYFFGGVTGYTHGQLSSELFSSPVYLGLAQWQKSGATNWQLFFSAFRAFKTENNKIHG